MAERTRQSIPGATIEALEFLAGPALHDVMPREKHRLLDQATLQEIIVGAAAKVCVEWSEREAAQVRRELLKQEADAWSQRAAKRMKSSAASLVLTRAISDLVQRVTEDESKRPKEFARELEALPSAEVGALPAAQLTALAGHVTESRQKWCQA